MTMGFHTALDIATEAIDRLHSTAHSHHRIIVLEIMGHRAGWLALGAGIAGGADVILIPEIPYDSESVANAIRSRVRSGKKFSIVAVAEGAMSSRHAKKVRATEAKLAKADNKPDKKKAKEELARLAADHTNHTLHLSRELEELTGLESRVTILGHLQRGGTPSAADRILATRLGSACVEMINEDKHGILVAARGESVTGVPLEEVAGKRKLVPLDHPWITSARWVGTNFGD
jgi:6-phosphofructokinase 1